MTYSIISNNLKNNNHSKRIYELFENSTEVTIASPFLMSDIADFLSELKGDKLTKLRLITTLKPNSHDQIKKVTSLLSLLDYPAFKSKEVELEISINNKLHGKVYIFKREQTFKSAVISSANFTESGLSLNHEWGVEIEDDLEITALYNALNSTIEFRDIPTDKIYQMQDEVSNYLAEKPEKEDPDIDLELIQLIAPSDQPYRDTVYWLKPIGVTEDPIKEGVPFKNNTDRLHFEKRRPNGVKENHILIAYGVGTSKVISIYRAKSKPMYVTQEEIEKTNWLARWPWYVIGENLTPKFGAHWWKHNLRINPLKEEFLAREPEKTVTAVGGKTLGALNFGKDKLKLSPDFARFIMDKVHGKLGQH